jgi:sulfur carrier protein ThiS
MMIELQVSAALQQKVPPSEKDPGGDQRDVPEGTNVSGVLDMLGLSDEATILVVNGRQENKNRTLKEGDVLTIYPAISGG